MHSITDTTAAFAAIVAGMWCTTAMYSLRTVRAIATTAINRANPCDLAAVLGALPPLTSEIARLRVTAKGLA